MKLIYKLSALLYITLLCTTLSGCSSENEGDGEFKMSQLVGSEWTAEYGWIDEDNGDYEEGTSNLIFTSSSSVTEHTKYHGKHWEYNYNLGIDEYKSYNGESDYFYNYTVSGNDIILDINEFGDKLTLHNSGNKLIEKDGDRIWTLIKAGEDTDNNENNEEESYSWSNMQGIWMEETYEMYEAIINQYQKQNMSSSKFFNDSEYGNFRVFGIQFNKEGLLREVDVQMKSFKNTGRAVLKTIKTSDGKTIYWTDISRDDYFGNKYIINKNKIYLNGQDIYEIINNKTIKDIVTGDIYVKAQ